MKADEYAQSLVNKFKYDLSNLIEYVDGMPVFSTKPVSDLWVYQTWARLRMKRGSRTRPDTLKEWKQDRKWIR